MIQFIESIYVIRMNGVPIILILKDRKTEVIKRYFSKDLILFMS